MRLLQSCADSALGDIYAFTSSAVLDDLEASLTNSLLRGRLARADIAANRYLHTPREELGGALLALHPIGSVILDSRKAIELLMAHVLNPGDLDARDRFNAILIIATRMYSELVGEQLSDEVTTESDCRDSDKPDNPTPIDLARSAIESPDVEAASNEMHEWIRKALDQDEELQRDKPVFMDRAFHGLSVAEVAKIHGISAGEVSKRTAAVQKRLKALAIRRGFLPGDD